MRKLIIIFFCLVSLGFRAQTTEMESRYNALSARFEVRDKLLQRDLKAYLEAFPYTTFADEVRFMQGVLQVEKGQHKQGLRTLEQVDAKALSRNHQTDYSFYRGYAYLMVQDYHRASIYFAQLSRTDNRYSVRATYYNGYCLYKEQKYEAALPVFLKLEKEPAYSKTIPYYLAQIYYALGEYEEAATRAETLLREHPDAANANELHRMLGEMYYLKQEYREAVNHLKQYHKAATAQKEGLVRNDLYMLGSAQFQLGDYAEAVKYLKMVKQEKDTISEAACLTMGNAYVQLGQPEQAKLSYQAAMSYGLTPTLKEEAAYNYTLCTYQSSSALGEAVRAFNDFLHQFPDSKYENRVYQLLSDALVQSKNYAAAISVLDSIANPTSKMVQTKQYLRYKLAADLFLQGKMQQVVEWTTEIITHSNESADYTGEAYYLRAEANYRLRNYTACEKDLNMFFAGDISKSPNALLARYLQGYCYFSQREYEKALTAFSRYTDEAMATEPSYADALNRIGDCYFTVRQFPQAIQAYTKVCNMNASGSDYALFQRGYALGLQHNYADKVSIMSELVTRYPKSDYADDGLYEKARAQLRMDRDQEAIATYEQLLATYPHSSLARKASLECAMLYRNLHQNGRAITAYRQTIEKYPATEEAYTALDALQALYVEEGNVSDYVEYTKQLTKYNMNVSTQEDSLLYVAAEMQYMQAAYQKAAVSFTNYISMYCAGGRYCTTARYYLADSYYRMEQYGEALAQYAVLAEMNANPYQEEASTRVAEICYDKGDYACAMEGFFRMLELASSRENMMIARLGVLRCAQALGQHERAISIADQILKDPPMSEETKNEALYSRAKARIGLGQWNKVQADLRVLAAEVRTEQGAEAMYLLAQSYFEARQLDLAESEIMRFTQMDTQQQYWLARALILLSEINRERGEYFQARQYLLVLQQNYTLAGDDIAERIESHLAELDRLEQPEVKNDNEEED